MGATKNKTKNLHRPNQPKPKKQKYYIVQMKSAKGEPMNGNMPAVR